MHLFFHGIAAVYNYFSGPGQPKELYLGRLPLPKLKNSSVSANDFVNTSRAVAHESCFSPPTQLCFLLQAELLQETMTLCDCRQNFSSFTEICLSE